MFSAVGALYGTQLFLQDLQHSNVACVLSTHEAWSDIRHGTISALGRWRRRHTFLPNPAISWKVAFDFRHTVGTILSETGHRRPKRLFRFLYQRLAGAELHRWETYLEQKVQAKGWDGPTLRRTLRHLPRSVPQPHRWFLLKVHLNAPIASARLVAARVVEEPVQCCFYSRSSDSLDHLPRCFTVLDVYSSIRDAANLPPVIDGRHSLMLQERWKGSVLAGIVAFFLPFGQSDRCTGVESIFSHSSN